jgi:hypothetical protein
MELGSVSLKINTQNTQNTEPHSQPRAVSVKEERGEMWKREEKERKGSGGRGEARIDR